jgi:hypothetical protein
MENPETQAVAPPQPLPAKPAYIPLPEPGLKFIGLSICTVGIYPLVWFFRLWKYFNRKYDMGASPFWRAFFAYFWIYPLFKLIQGDLEKRGREADFMPGFSAFLFFLVSVLYRLPQPWGIIALFSCLPLLPVHAGSNELLALEPANAGRRAEMNGWEWMILIMGGALTGFTVLANLIGIAK